MTTITTGTHADGRLTVRTSGRTDDLELELRPNADGFAVYWRGARIGALISDGWDALSPVWKGHLLGRVVVEARDEGAAAVALAGVWLREELDGLARAQARAHREQVGRIVSGGG